MDRHSPHIAGWHDAEGEVTDDDEGLTYYVTLRYWVNPGCKGDRITPAEPAFIEEVKVTEVTGIGFEIDSKDAAQVLKMVETVYAHQVEALAERAFDGKTAF